MVSDSVLVVRLWEVLRNSDLSTTTASAVRRTLEEEFGIDLSDRKAFFRNQIDLFLEGQTCPAGADDLTEVEIDEQGPVNVKTEDDSNSVSEEVDSDEESEGKGSDKARMPPHKGTCAGGRGRTGQRAGGGEDDMANAPPPGFGEAAFANAMATTLHGAFRATNDEAQSVPRVVESRATTAVKEFRRMDPPYFEASPDPLVAENWLMQVTKALDTLQIVDDDIRISLAAYQLRGEAEQWWESVKNTMTVACMEWETFRGLFLDKYFPQVAREAMRQAFVREGHSVSRVPSTQTHFSGVKRQRDATPSLPNHQPFTSLPSSSLAVGGVYHGSRVGHACGESGHVRADCPHPRSLAPVASVAPRPKLCYGCHQAGHILRDCTQGQRSQVTGSTSQQARSFQTPAIHSAPRQLALPAPTPISRGFHFGSVQNSKARGCEENLGLYSGEKSAKSKGQGENFM